MKRANIFNFVVLLYLYLPIAMFSLTWLNPWIGILATIVMCYLIWYGSLSKDNFNITWRRVWPFLLISMAILLVWALLSGLGGFFAQSYDWQKHNLLLKGFIDQSWPVHYQYKGHLGVVSYYIGEYILPALVGKLACFNVAQIFMCFWIVCGLVLLTISIYKWVGIQNGWIFLLIVFSLILFSTFIYPLSGIYNNWVPADANVMQDMGEWFSRSLQLQYTSNISLLRFVFPQFVPVALSTILFIRERENYQFWGIVLVPIVLYSTFAFIGLGLLMLLLVLRDLLSKKEAFRWDKLVNWTNLLSILVMAILVLYIACNILQPKPASDSMQLSLIDVWHHKLGFLTFQASWIIWILLLVKHERRNPLLYLSSVVLLILPFFKFGAANDLVMRVSIPALMIINFLVIKNIAIYWRKDIYYAAILVGGLIVAGAGPVWQLRNAAAHHTIHHQTYNMPYKTFDEFITTEKHTVYQYVDWHQSKLRSFLIRK